MKKTPQTVALLPLVGTFAENKEVAKSIRISSIIPCLKKNEEIILDFDGITSATQSFIHALLSQPIRDFRDIAYDNICYDNTSDAVREAISIVYRYMQESLDTGTVDV